MGSDDFLLNQGSHIPGKYSSKIERQRSKRKGVFAHLKKEVDKPAPP